MHSYSFKSKGTPCVSETFSTKWIKAEHRGILRDASRQTMEASEGIIIFMSLQHLCNLISVSHWLFKKTDTAKLLFVENSTSLATISS